MNTDINYKKMLLEMLEHCTDERQIRNIFFFVQSYLAPKKTPEQ